MHNGNLCITLISTSGDFALPIHHTCLYNVMEIILASLIIYEKNPLAQVTIQVMTCPMYGISPLPEPVMTFYASAFSRRRHYVFGMSVRPSVRSLKYPLLTCTWVRWSTRPTVTVLRHVRPSVHPSVCPSIRPSGEVSGHLPEKAWRERPEILHADVSWPSSELVSLWPWFVDFSNFGTILT